MPSKTRRRKGKGTTGTRTHVLRGTLVVGACNATKKAGRGSDTRKGSDASGEDGKDVAGGGGGGKGGEMEKGKGGGGEGDGDLEH